MTITTDRPTTPWYAKPSNRRDTRPASWVELQIETATKDAAGKLIWTTHGSRFAPLGTVTQAAVDLMVAVEWKLVDRLRRAGVDMVNVQRIRISAAVADGVGGFYTSFTTRVPQLTR